MLIRVKLVTSQLTMRHLADGMDEISSIEIFEPVLIWVMGVGLTMEVGSRRVLDPVFIMSILEQQLTHVMKT